MADSGRFGDALSDDVGDGRGLDTLPAISRVVILCSSTAEAFKAGALDFLEKPVNGQVCLELIHRALAQVTQ